jgi:hypothetical protein
MQAPGVGNDQRGTRKLGLASAQGRVPARIPQDPGHQLWDRGASYRLNNIGSNELPASSERRIGSQAPSIMITISKRCADRLVTKIDTGVIAMASELRAHERQAAEEFASCERPARQRNEYPAGGEEQVLRRPRRAPLSAGYQML